MEIINLARELGKAIQGDETYIDYKIKEQNVECDSELQKLIEEFNLKKTSINYEISKENVDNNKIDELNSVIGKMHEEIMKNEKMKSYYSAKETFEKELKKVNTIIMSSAMGQDPYTVSTDEENACGSGSCDTCSGCR